MLQGVRISALLLSNSDQSSRNVCLNARELLLLLKLEPALKDSKRTKIWGHGLISFMT